MPCLLLCLGDWLVSSQAPCWYLGWSLSQVLHSLICRGGFDSAVSRLCMRISTVWVPTVVREWLQCFAPLELMAGARCWDGLCESASLNEVASLVKFHTLASVLGFWHPSALKPPLWFAMLQNSVCSVPHASVYPNHPKVVKLYPNHPKVVKLSVPFVMIVVFFDLSLWALCTTLLQIKCSRN